MWPAGTVCAETQVDGTGGGLRACANTMRDAYAVERRLPAVLPLDGGRPTAWARGVASPMTVTPKRRVRPHRLWGGTLAGAAAPPPLGHTIACVVCVWDLLGQGRPDGLTTHGRRAGARHARPGLRPSKGLGLAVFGRALYPDPGHCTSESLLRVRIDGALPATTRTPSAPSAPRGEGGRRSASQ